jgi:AsnC-like helix-turn-helix protein
VVTAYILVQTEVGKAARVAEEIVQIQGVQQAEDVTGPYDVIVRAEARNIDELGQAGGRAGAGGQRHHQDPHLPGGPPLALLDQAGTTLSAAAPGAVRPARGRLQS